MNRIMTVSKYQLKELVKAMMVFYFVMIVLTIFFSTVFIAQVGHNSEETRFGGYGASTAVFIFITGLNCFKTSFKFFKANNTSAKKIYLGTILALLFLALSMALIDTLLNETLETVVGYESLHLQLYHYSSFLSELIWSAGLYALSGYLGWMVTMIYYRCNTIMKIIVSASPLILTVFLLNQFAKGIWVNEIVSFFTHIMGFAYGNNAYIGAGSLLLGSVLIALLCYLLIYRAPIKE